MALRIHNRIARSDVALGLCAVRGIVTGPAPAALSAALDAAIAARKAAPLTPAEEARRSACRDMLRNGSYKPTGRGKPASEYLVREAVEGTFPRINGPVDANNLVSLASLVPISLWDLDFAGTSEFEFRLGAAGEQYVFNQGGQTLELRDLMLGAGLIDGRSQPMVTPIKDSLATKTKPSTTRVAACLYYPLGTRAELETITAELERWLRLCGDNATGSRAVAMPGESVALDG